VFDEVTEFSRHWPLEPFDHPMADDGTFHVYVEDVAETIDGFQAEDRHGRRAPVCVCQSGLPNVLSPLRSRMLAANVGGRHANLVPRASEDQPS
jgi:hypothetical protein